MALDEKKLNEDKKQKSPLAEPKNNDPLKQINEKMDGIINMLYVRQIEDRINIMTNEIMDGNKLRDEKIDELFNKINSQNELLQDIKEMMQNFINQNKNKEENFK